MYKSFFRPILFRFGAERVHHLTVGGLRLVGRIPLVRAIVRRMFTLADPRLERTVLGMKFPNPVGMAAGFDKDARVYRELGMLGLGFVEVGTVTPLPQPGNPRPRLFRLVKDRAIINRMGFNNDGMEAAACNLRGRLRDIATDELPAHPHEAHGHGHGRGHAHGNGQAPRTDKTRRKKHQIVGINIGKNTATPNENAPQDYLKAFRRLYDLGDYFVVNVSCPNVAGLASMQTEAHLLEIVEPLLEYRHGQDEYKPVLVKISPDLSFEEIDAVVKVVMDTLVDGIVAANTTTSREGLHISHKRLDAIGRGGLSGAPLTRRAIETVRYVREKTEGRYPIIGTGGVMTTDDALAMLDAGADLVQIYTGLIYNGPGFARRICKALLAREKSI
ncbi:MAG: dihydroorotate dehydrogenase 2 [Alistipes sp.]|jgi:dihydroorotate dehydrogenase|nr:dihydroorotate dehydrogenase 2 [Alistipes sp.]